MATEPQIVGLKSMTEIGARVRQMDDASCQQLRHILLALHDFVESIQFQRREDKALVEHRRREREMARLEEIRAAEFPKGVSS